MKTILITGSNGLLGQNLIKLLMSKNTYNIYGVSRGENRLKNKAGYTYTDLDITDRERIRTFIRKIKPDVIFHTAAMTNVDQCELHRKECDLINVEVVKNLVSVCEDQDIHLIHISTDFIFDGQKGYYTEEDEPNPVNYYGLSKLRSEQLIVKSKVSYTILRTILVFGLTDEMKSNIVLWVKNNVENRQKINVVTDQLRMPTLVDDLAKACIYAFENRVEGVFHISSNTLMSIYEVALAVADEFNLDKSYINPIPTSMLDQPAKRPPKTGFELTKSINRLNLASRSFVELLQVFKNQIE